MLLGIATLTHTTAAPVTFANSDSRNCTASRQLLIGAWSQDNIDREPSEVFPDGDSRTFEFAIESRRRVFREHMHYRPAGFGEWTLTRCRLTIHFSVGGRVEYQIQRLDRLHLWLSDTTPGSEVERFSRIVN